MREQRRLAGFVMSAVCPVYPQQQTFPDPVGTSHLGQFRKWRTPWNALCPYGLGKKFEHCHGRV
jgi:hypothetical protein